MYSLTDLCSLCLVNSETIISISSKDADGIVVKNKLKYALSEVLYYKPEILKNICIDCLKSLNYVYKFKQKCLQNVMSLNDFIEQMTVENEESNYFVATELQNQATEQHFLASKTQSTPQGDETMNTNLVCGNLTQQNVQNIVKNEPEDVNDTEMQYNSSVFAETTENPPEINNTTSNAELLSTNSVYIKHSNMLCEHTIPESNECGNEDTFNVKKEYIPDELKYDPLLSDEEILLSDEATNNSEPEAVQTLKVKSKDKYEGAYQQFESWCNKKKVKMVREESLLAYFEEKSQTLKSSSLWCQYSMLRTTISLKKNVDIRNFVRLITFIKRKSIGHKAKKVSVLSRAHIEKFLREADDDTYLLMKVVLIIGISGACGRDELAYLHLDNIKDLGSEISIEVPHSTKSNEKREFTISSGNIAGINLVEIVRKYVSLRPSPDSLTNPSKTENRRFFLAYRNGKCTKQSVGINSIGAVPKKIAEYLNLPNPANYTGHSFRRSSMAVLCDCSGEEITVKRLGGWL